MTTLTADDLWTFKPDARGWRCSAPGGGARQLHESLPGYAPTPVREAPGLARELGVARVLIKDESERFDLGAFKVLGASWAVFRAVARHTGFTGNDDVATLRRHLADTTSAVTLVSATDGNHGRAVARMATELGLQARVFVPQAVPSAVVDRVRREAAVVTVVDGNYDAAILAARHWADTHLDAVVVQDTSWDGYEDVPTWIVDGYATLFAELDDQLRRIGVDAPSAIAVPAGVGSLAQAAIMHYRSPAGPGPLLIAVEPDTAACIHASLRAGRIETVATTSTLMNGLNCGTPSLLAWPYLRDGLNATVVVTDDQCVDAMHRLSAEDIHAGPSGAASTAGMTALLTGPGAPARRRALQLDDRAVVVCLNTEGPIE